MNTSELLHSLGFSERVVFVAVTPNGKNLISGETYNIIKIWKLNELELLKNLGTYSDSSGHPFWWHKCIVITPDNQRIIACRKIIKVHDLETGKLLSIIGRDLGWIYALAITPDGKKLISGHDKSIKIWDLTKKYPKILLTLKSSAKEVNTLVVTPDGQRIVSAGRRIISTLESEEKTNSESWIEIWDLNTGERLH